MERSKSKVSIQKRLARPLLDRVGALKKQPNHQECLRIAGLAIASVVLDTRVPLEVVKKDLEDLREAIDFAIDIVKAGADKNLLN
jgi:hypothetical protein